VAVLIPTRRHISFVVLAAAQYHDVSSAEIQLCGHSSRGVDLAGLVTGANGPA